jgi:hypothetical protein
MEAVRKSAGIVADRAQVAARRDVPVVVHQALLGELAVLRAEVKVAELARCSASTTADLRRDDQTREVVGGAVRIVLDDRYAVISVRLCATEVSSG